MKILVVEDDKKIAQFIKRGLELEKEKFEVQTAPDGEEGLRLALEKSYEMIVLDWMLPRKDGLSVLKELRRKKNQTPVLMLTAKYCSEDIVAGLDSGSDGYLTKPFAFPELLARVRALIRISKRDRGADVRFSDLRLDQVKHKVWRQGKEIHLTIKEYGLIEYFMRNPRQVVTRAMIAQHCWDNDTGNFSNIIDVYVNYLRKKVDRKPGKKLIHTVRGVGYILMEEG